MTHFTFATVITIFVPGSFVYLALALIAETTIGGTRLYDRLSAVAASEWQFALFFLIASSFLGCLVWTLGAYVETWIDWRCIRRMCREEAKENHTYTSDDYWKEWYAFVDASEKHINPRIRRSEEYFLFALRSSLGLVSLTGGLFVWAQNGLEIWLTIASGIMAVLLFVSAVDSHAVQAEFRHRRFGKERAVSATLRGGRRQHIRLAHRDRHVSRRARTMQT